MSDQDRISPYNQPDKEMKRKKKNINKGKKLIQNQILWTNIPRIAWQKVKRINKVILGERGKGKISAQPHTSSCIHIWGFIIQCKTNKMCMHNEVWACAEIFPG